jgi:UDP-N-acetylmuramate dehydrogenase
MTLPAGLVDALWSLLGDRARPDEPLARHTSFRIGGPADVLVLPDTAQELAAVLRTAATHGARTSILGGARTSSSATVGCAAWS